MNKIIDLLVSNDSTIIGFFSISLLLIGGALSQAGRWLLTIVFSYFKSTQDIQIRERDMDIRDFITNRFDRIDEAIKESAKRLDGIDKRLDGIETDVKDLNRRWNYLPFAQFLR